MCDFKLWEFPHFYSKTESAIKFNPNRSCLTLSRKTSTSSNTCVVEIMEAFLCTAHDRAQRRCCIQIQPWMKGDLYGCLEEASAQRHTKLSFFWCLPLVSLHNSSQSIVLDGNLNWCQGTQCFYWKWLTDINAVSEQKCNVWMINTWQKSGKTRFYKSIIIFCSGSIGSSIAVAAAAVRGGVVVKDVSSAPRICSGCSALLFICVMVKGLLCLPAQCQAHGEDSRRQASTPGKGGRGGWSTQMSQQQDCYLLLCIKGAGGAPQGSYKMTFNRPTLCIGLPKLSKDDLSGQALGFWASTESFGALQFSSWMSRFILRTWCDRVEGVLMFHGGGSVIIWVGVSLEACTDLHMLDRSTLTALFSPAGNP